MNEAEKAILTLSSQGLTIAASVAILIGNRFSFRQSSSPSSAESHSYHVAYVDGHRLSDEAAILQIEAQKRAADDFIREMSERESHNKKNDR